MSDEQMKTIRSMMDAKEVWTELLNRRAWENPVLPESLRISADAICLEIQKLNKAISEAMDAYKKANPNYVPPIIAAAQFLAKYYPK